MRRIPASAPTSSDSVTTPVLHNKAGIPVKIGDKVADFRGEKATVTGWTAPRHSGSTGRIHVKCKGHIHEYYPSVYDCQFV